MGFPLARSNSVSVFFGPDDRSSKVYGEPGKLTLTRTYSSPDLTPAQYDYCYTPSHYPYYYKSPDYRYVGDPWYYYNAKNDYWYSKYRYWLHQVYNDTYPYKYPYRDYMYSYWNRYKPRVYDHTYPYTYSSYINPFYRRPYRYSIWDYEPSVPYYRPLTYYSHVGSIPDRLI